MEMFDKFTNLLVMAAADGSLTEREIQFLTERSARWSISDHDFAKAIEYALSHQARLTIPNDQHERVEMLQDLIRMMAADGQLADVEKQLFAIAAAKMGISGEVLNRIIDSIV